MMKITINSIEITYGPIPDTGHPCYRCKTDMFSITTPMGGDFTTCALCGGLNYDPYDRRNDDRKDFLSYQGNYCESCGILSDIANIDIHANNGCTEDIFIAQLIESFEIDGKKYKGMPRFNSIKDAITLLPIIKNNWINTKNPGYCPNASYPQSDFSDD